MAGDFNEFTCIGRLTRDPVSQAVGQSSVVKFGIAFCGERRKNNQTGEWEEKPCFLDCEAWNFPTGRKIGEVIVNYVRKGHRIFLKGRLKLDQWTDQASGQKRSAHKLTVTEVILLEKKDPNGTPPTDGGYGGQNEHAPQADATPAASGGYGSGDEIPF